LAGGQGNSERLQWPWWQTLQDRGSCSHLCRHLVLRYPCRISYALHHRLAAVNKTASENPFPEDNQSKQPVAASKREIHLGTLIGQLLFTGLASPFLAFAGNFGSAALGLFILFIGLRIAWTMTQARALNVDGPYSASTT
jgi:hypothetical protein